MRFSNKVIDHARRVLHGRARGRVTFRGPWKQYRDILRDKPSQGKVVGEMRIVQFKRQDNTVNAWFVRRYGRKQWEFDSADWVKK